MLDVDEALVLFEFLSQWSNDAKSMELGDPSEAIALDGLLAQLKKQLVEPFRADYAGRLQKGIVRGPFHLQQSLHRRLSVR